MEYNIYCDESCHLQNDSASTMVLGAVTCHRDQVARVSEELRRLKMEYHLLSTEDRQKGRQQQFEVKWTKVSPAKVHFYRDWIKFFFAEPALSFRAVVINKSDLDHQNWELQHGKTQSHDDWYYKMFFRLIEPMIDPESNYHIYLDIKDTRSECKRRQLEKVLRSSKRDRAVKIIGRVQQIRSHESELMQMTDLLLGALCFHHRRSSETERKSAGLHSSAKSDLVSLVQRCSRQNLNKTSWLKQKKFNIFLWKPPEDIS